MSVSFSITELDLL